MSQSKEELHSAITAKAELDRTVSRLIIEDVTSVMAKNLSTILEAMDRQHVESMDALKDGAARLGKLESRMDTGDAERADLRHRIEVGDAERADLREWLARIEAIVSKRPSETRIEHQAILDAIAQQRGDGDG